MSKFFKPASVATAVTLALSSSAVFAQQNAVVVESTLDPIVVTASRSEENTSRIPARINVIASKTIEQNPLLNISDLLQKDASIYVKQSGGMGQIPEVSLRGTNPVHTLYLRDGARLNTQNNVSPIFTGFLDASDVEHVEILKGPASVQYGSDAIGGVIQLISQKPTKTGGFITGVYGENETYKAIVGADVVIENGLYAQVRGQRLESDGTRIFDTQPESQKASYDQKGYSAKVGFTRDEKIDTSLSISHNEGVNIFSTDGGTSNIAPREFENQTVNAIATFKPHQDLAVGLRYSNVQDKQKVPAYASHYDTSSNEIDSNVKWNFAQNQNILVGITTNHSEYKSNTITDTKQKIKTTGYYAQHQYNTDFVNTQVGVRVEDNERFGTHTVGQGAIRVHVAPTTSVYANIGSAFRAPSLNELYTQWGGNPDLKPEESVSYELGLDQRIGDNLVANVSAYRTNVKNLITNPTWSLNENIGKATFKGAETGLKWKQNDFFVNGQYAYVKTENKQTGLEIAYRPKHTGTLTVGLENQLYGFSVSAIARSKANAQNSVNSVKVPHYVTADINTYWNINPNVKVFANVENIADVKYRQVYNTFPTTNWYINGGRQASAGVTFRF